jgi:hypothetical protein
MKSNETIRVSQKVTHFTQLKASLSHADIGMRSIVAWRGSNSVSHHAMGMRVSSVYMRQI